MVSLRWIAAVVAVFSAACVSEPPPAKLVSRTEVGSAQLRDLMGLTQSEIRAKLGLPASGDVVVSRRLWLEGATQFYDLELHDLSRGECSGAAKGERARYRVAPADATFVFEDGRLMSAYHHRDYSAPSGGLENLAL